MDFSTKDDEMLITLVSFQPRLYNMKLVEYKDIASKDLLWKDIGKQMNKSYKDCKKRWKHIKDSYNRYKRRIKHKKIQPNPKKTNWQIYEQLGFLETELTQHVELDSRTEDTLFIVKEHNSDSDEELHDDSVSSNAEVFFEENSMNYESDRSSKATKQRRSKDHDSKTALNYFQSMNETLDTFSINVTQKNDDDIASFCTHIGDVLKSLPAIYKIKAKQDIFNVITNYEILAAQNTDK